MVLQPIDWSKGGCNWWPAKPPGYITGLDQGRAGSYPTVGVLQSGSSPPFKLPPSLLVLPTPTTSSRKGYMTSAEFARREATMPELVKGID